MLPGAPFCFGIMGNSTPSAPTLITSAKVYAHIKPLVEFYSAIEKKEQAIDGSKSLINL